MSFQAQEEGRGMVAGDGAGTPSTRTTDPDRHADAPPNDGAHVPAVLDPPLPTILPDQWVVQLPPLLASTNVTLEKFHVLKWREIYLLAKLLAAARFRRVRLAGDDHALYESFYRSFPHQMVSKARLTGVARAVLGLDGDDAGVKSTMPREAVELCRHLERMQYAYELSSDNVLVLNWRLLLVGLHLFLHPLQSMREHLAFGFRLFGSTGFLDALNDATTVQTADAALMLTQLLRNQACMHLVSKRFRQAQVLQPTGSLTPANIRQRMTVTRLSYRHFQQLLALAPLHALFDRATDHTVVLEEMASPIYREWAFRTRKKDADRKKIDRLRYFHHTKRLRRAFVLWNDTACVMKRTRTLMVAAFQRLARLKRAHAFQRVKQHAIQSWAATVIQRIVRGMRGRRIAEDKWLLVQAAVKVQGAFRTRSHFVQFMKDMRHRHRAAIRLQRVYRGRVGRVKARQRLLAVYYDELDKVQRERELFREFVRGEMAKRIQRLFGWILQRRNELRTVQDARERESVELEMLEMASDATRLVRRHKQEVTAKYEKLREDHEYKQRRMLIDGAEKNKVIRLRRQRQWGAFKSQRVELRERRKRESADAYNHLKAQWDPKIDERTKRKRLFVAHLLELDDPGEWKTLQKQLRALVAEKEKQLKTKYKQSQVALTTSEVHERAKLEAIDEEVEKERRAAEGDWLKVEADFLHALDVQEEERMLQENAEEWKRREKCAVLMQSAFRMFAARKQLKHEIHQCFVKEFDVRTQLPMYRNSNSADPRSARKPYGLGPDDLTYQDQWVLIADEVAGQPFFYHPETLRQSWEKPDDCQCCISCNLANRVAFAAFWNAEEDQYLCQSCYDTLRQSSGSFDLQPDLFFPCDGSKRIGY